MTVHNDSNWTAIRMRLEQMRQEHLARINAGALAEIESPEATEGPRESYDAGDLSTYELAEGERLGDAERATRELRQIEAALERMERGVYGHCVDCGRPIPEKRLQAMPTAERCTAHQQRYEKEHAVAHPTL